MAKPMKITVMLTYWWGQPGDPISRTNSFGVHREIVGETSFTAAIKFVLAHPTRSKLTGKRRDGDKLIAARADSVSMAMNVNGHDGHLYWRRDLQSEGRRIPDVWYHKP